MTAALCEHLWQSTLFAGAAWLLTLALRNRRASLRHGVWLAASVKFLIPFSLLTTLGEAMDLDLGAPAREAVASAVVVFTPLSASAAGAVLEAPHTINLRTALAWCWIAGSFALALRWLGAWLRSRAALRASKPLEVDAPIPARASSPPIAPGVIGVLRPVLLLPGGLAERIPSEQLEAVIEHELCHIARRDNLKTAVHMLVETVFWFHPLVWWIGARLLEERERACDEAVLEAGHAPERYAAAILSVCRSFHRPALLGAAASGGDLTRRIEHILTARVPDELTRSQRALLAALASLSLIAPIAAGAMVAGEAREAASASAHMETLVLAFRRAGEGNDARRVHVFSGRLRDLIGLLYGVDGSQVRSDARWLSSRTYRVEAAPSIDPSAYRTLLTALLAERFNLQIYVNRRCQRPCGRSEQRTS